MRIGHGYDVHRLEEGRQLIIGGVHIPYERGLVGHSDADVLAHAVSDALLGAAKMRDIGAIFPDHDPQYKGADSLMLLTRVITLLHGFGYHVINIDATIIAQEPKMSPFIDEMCRNIARCCKVEEADINIKATTEEGLGFADRGMAAHAVCLIDGERGRA